MAEITAAMVKELRDSTGVGMMDCKAALNETGGDIEAAVDWLRKKGLAKAAKKAGRVAAEGLVALATAGNKAVVVEVNAETDFVARNAEFQSLVAQIGQTALNSGATSVEALQAAQMDGATVADKLTQAVATIGENMTLRRMVALSVPQGVVAAYVHNAVAPNLGKIGVLVALQSSGNADALAALGKQIAMHIAATNPVALDSTKVPADVVEREKAVMVDKARQQGKPDNVIEKIVESGLKTYFKEICLLDQQFVIDPSKTIAQLLKEAAGVGAEVQLVDYTRFALGEGIQKEESDFAAEVAAAAGVA